MFPLRCAAGGLGIGMRLGVAPHQMSDAGGQTNEIAVCLLHVWRSHLMDACFLLAPAHDACNPSNLQLRVLQMMQLLNIFAVTFKS